MIFSPLLCSNNVLLWGQWPMEYQGVSIFPNIFSLCSFICLQAVYQLSGAVCKATWNGYPSYSLLTFILRFVIDFLSIRKVIIFSAIATDGRPHPMVTFYTPKCCKLHDDSFPLYCAILGGTENLLRTLT